VIARPHALHRVADRIDDARGVGPDDEGGHDRDPGQPLEEEEIEVVERGRAHTHAHVGGRAELGHRQGVAPLQPVDAPPGGDGEASHGWGRVYIPARNLTTRSLMLSIKVPPLGESIVEATISRWLKKEGDAVASGETLVELETDKITVEVPALSAGVLTKRHK